MNERGVIAYRSAKMFFSVLSIFHLDQSRTYPELLPRRCSWQESIAFDWDGVAFPHLFGSWDPALTNYWLLRPSRTLFTSKLVEEIFVTQYFLPVMNECGVKIAVYDKVRNHKLGSYYVDTECTSTQLTTGSFISWQSQYLYLSRARLSSSGDRLTVCDR